MRLTIRRTWAIPSLAASAALLVVTAGAATAVETDTVATFWRGLWWSLSLMTTVGFLGDPPQTTQGAMLSVVLMLSGFFLLALVSAALASLFVRDDERVFESKESAEMAELLAEVRRLGRRIDELHGQPGTPGHQDPPSTRPRATP